MARKTNTRANDRSGRTTSSIIGSTPVSWVRTAIRAPRGRPIRVLIYGRFSTDEQNPRSINDQVAYCRRFLEELGPTAVDVEVIADEGISGELVSRPGIDRVHAGVCDHGWDLVLCEDSSRLYRHETACAELIETAVDEDIRVICINDFVDTANEDEWEDRLHEAMRHHSKTNRYTSRRIKRAHDGLWELGAAIGLLNPGYLRRPTYPATEREPARGPFFDEIDPRWREVIYEAFERIARGDPTWLVAQWLTTTGLPKTANSLVTNWMEKNVIALAQNPIYRGFEVFRKTISKKKFRSGKRKQRKNDRSNVRTREMRELQIVPDWLWHAANDAIESRTTCVDVPSGADHPLFGIPRDSRGPLSNVFICGRCGRKMHASGRNEGGYRCSGVRGGLCWNKATALQTVSHKQISLAILNQLPQVESRLDDVLSRARQLVCDDEPRRERRCRLQADIFEHRQALDRLTDAIERCDDAPDGLVERYVEREHELATRKAELERLDRETPAVPSAEEFSGALRDLAAKLQEMGREVGPELKRIVQTIEAVPYQQYGSNLVVLRARFELHVSAFLPYSVVSFLQCLHGETILEFLGRIPMLVDLFKPSSAAEFAHAALKLKEQGLTLVEIGEELGIRKRKAHLAVQLGRKLQAAGLEDPYIELTQPPKNASRWRNSRPAA